MRKHLHHRYQHGTDNIQIRQARLQQLQSQQSSNTNEDQAAQQQQAAQDQRSSILNQILEPAAADRLGRIRLVKASRADQVEDRLIGLARSGQLRAKVTEEQLKDLLNALAEQTGASENVNVVSKRSRSGWDDDDLDDLLNET